MIFGLKFKIKTRSVNWRDLHSDIRHENLCRYFEWKFGALLRRLWPFPIVISNICLTFSLENVWIAQRRALLELKKMSFWIYPTDQWHNLITLYRPTSHMPCGLHLIKSYYAITSLNTQLIIWNCHHKNRKSNMIFIRPYSMFCNNIIQ